MAALRYWQGCVPLWFQTVECGTLASVLRIFSLADTVGCQLPDTMLHLAEDVQDPFFSRGSRHHRNRCSKIQCTHWCSEPAHRLLPVAHDFDYSFDDGIYCHGQFRFRGYWNRYALRDVLGGDLLRDGLPSNLRIPSFLYYLRLEMDDVFPSFQFARSRGINPLAAYLFHSISLYGFPAIGDALGCSLSPPQTSGRRRPQRSESHPPKTHRTVRPRTPDESLPGFQSLYALTSICSVEYTKRVESVFEIIAEPNRRAILSLLVSSEQSVGEIERQLRMPQPAVSKHLRVLREAGFVESTVDAQRRLYRLKPEPLQEVDAWLAPFRRFWSAHIDALERHLDRMDQSTPTKKKTRRRRRGPNRERDKGETK
jgi:DNA-binding transcriptional ArsR family regulator